MNPSCGFLWQPGRWALAEINLKRPPSTVFALIRISRDRRTDPAELKRWKSLDCDLMLVRWYQPRLLSWPLINGHKLGGTAQEAEGSNGRSAASLVRPTRRLYLVCSSLAAKKKSPKKKGRHFFRANVTRDKEKIRFKAKKETRKRIRAACRKTRNSFGAGRKSFHPSVVFSSFISVNSYAMASAFVGCRFDLRVCVTGDKR